MKFKIFFVGVLLFLLQPLYASSIDAVRAKLAKLSEPGHERAKASLYDELGTLLYKQGQMPEAAAAFETALQHDATRSMRRHIYLYMGKSYESHDRLDKAIAAYEEAAAYDKRHWRRYRDLAWLYEQTELYRKAIASYETALRYNPKEASLFLAIGRTWRKMGLYPEAIPYLNQALAAEHQVNTAQYELSMAFEGEGKFAEAAQACAKSLSSESAVETDARLVYLAALAGDHTLARQGLDQMTQRHASKETIRFYGNLVELLSSPSENIRADKTQDPNLQSLLQSIGSEGKTE